MVFNSTFNNISAISWRSVLLVEETRVPGGIIDPPEVTDKLAFLGQKRMSNFTSIPLKCVLNAHANLLDYIQ
jgi:hypothetical protein